MDNLLQPVLCNFPKYCFEKQKTPSYVEMYSKINREIIMVYQKIKATTLIDITSKSNNSEKEEFDLTGSPLKLDLSLHTILDDTMISDEPQLWSKEEGMHAPIDIEKAREIANLYNLSLTQVFKEESLPMWILCSPCTVPKPLLLSVHSDSQHFDRGIANYEGLLPIEDVDVCKMVEDFAVQEKLSEELVNIAVDCNYQISGISYGTHNAEELVNAPHNGLTELKCEWSGKTLQTPFISCKVNFEQEVIVGHLQSPCDSLWKSVCSLHNMNQLLVDMTAAGYTAVNLETAPVRHITPGSPKLNNAKRLHNLLNETETYAYTAECPTGGCICITEDTTTLKQCLNDMCKIGSSNDFTYKLWDVLKDSESADELIILLIHALKFISTGKIRPFIDSNNKTYLSKLVLKLSRGHSQCSKVLKNLRSSPPQALSLVAQVGAEKTMWEYTKVMTLLEHSFFIAGIWTTEARTHESIEQINQTINDMTMSGGDFTLNPFESLSTGDHSIRFECESFYDDDPNELTVDDFASLKKHGLGAEKKDANEVPLIADEIDISPWKNLLTKFAQVHVCLEHLYRTETSLRADFANLKPIASYLLEHYVSEKSPIRTVGQLMSDPVQRVTMPIANNAAQDHLKKPASWYRVEISRKEKAADMGIRRNLRAVHVFSQQAVFPPSVWQSIDPPSDEVAEITTVDEEVKYHHTKYIHICNKLASKVIL